MSNLIQILCFLILVLVSGYANAELRIEVTKGVDNAVSIAVVPFEWRGRGKFSL